MISKALAEVNGSVTHAAALLGRSYQGLAYLIKLRHPDLLKERSSVRHAAIAGVNEAASDTALRFAKQDKGDAEISDGGYSDNGGH